MKGCFELYLLQTQAAFVNIDKSHYRRYNYGENFALPCLESAVL